MTGDGSEYLRAEDLRELGDDSLPGHYLDGFSYMSHNLDRWGFSQRTQMYADRHTRTRTRTRTWPNQAHMQKHADTRAGTNMHTHKHTQNQNCFYYILLSTKSTIIVLRSSTAT